MDDLWRRARNALDVAKENTPCVGILRELVEAWDRLRSDGGVIALLVNTEELPAVVYVPAGSAQPTILTAETVVMTEKHARLAGALIQVADRAVQAELTSAVRVQQTNG